MYCTICGTKNEQNAHFCHICGQQLNAAQAAPETTPISSEAAPEATPAAPVRKPRRSRKALWITLTVVVLVLAIGATTAFLLLRETPRKIAEKYIAAYYNADADAIFDLIHEDVLKEQYGSKSDIRDAEDNLEGLLENNLEWYDEDYEEWSVEYRVIDVETLKGDALEEIQDLYDDEYDCEVTAAKEVAVKLIWDLDGYYRTYVNFIIIIEIDGDWYLDCTQLSWWFWY